MARSGHIEHSPAGDGPLRRVASDDETIGVRRGNRRFETQLGKASRARFDPLILIKDGDPPEDLRGAGMNPYALSRSNR